MATTVFPRQVQFLWQISDAATQSHYLETGENIETARSLTFDLATSDERAAVLALPGATGTVFALMRLDPERIVYKIEQSNNQRHPGTHVTGVSVPLGDWRRKPVNDEPLTEADARALLLALSERYQEQMRLGQIAYDAAKAEDAARLAEYQAAKDAKLAAAEAAKLVAETERANWIAEHGSDFLRKAVGAGYDCQRRYVQERASIEFPGFFLDWKSEGRWRSRSCPSESSLDRALELCAVPNDGCTATVVWLTVDPTILDDDQYLYGDDVEREAIVIENYLDKYTLVSFS